MAELSPEWKSFINTELSKPYMVDLKKRIKDRRAEITVYPESNLTFNAFVQCPYHDLKVVILGQDPYHTFHTAHGLAFSSLQDQTPPSLRIIFDAIFKDEFNGNTGGVVVHQHNNLEQWAWQGVMLLNTILTVDEGKAKSHAGWGWEQFTEEAIKYINMHKHKLVWMLWGKDAKSYRHLIDDKKHLVLEAEHPAASAYAGNPWDYKDCFSKSNQFIKKHYFNIKPPINWGIFREPRHILR